MIEKSYENNSIATQGYRHFLAEKKKMLDRFDQAMLQSESHEVEYFYKGMVAEAEFRKWLSTFLPKRFGVTSGYVVSQRLSEKHKTPHFDVIIYNKLDAPVIGIEESTDISQAGNSQVLPVEHVLAIIEIKASLNARNAGKAIEHLGDLKIFLDGIDPANELYKQYLPPVFSSYVVFFEMGRHLPAHLNKLVPKETLRGYQGGLVLRVKESNPEKSMRMYLSTNDGKKIIETKTDSSQFQMFAFDLLFRLSHTIKNPYFMPISSFHGFPEWMFTLNGTLPLIRP